MIMICYASRFWREAFFREIPMILTKEVKQQLWQMH